MVLIPNAALRLKGHNTQQSSYMDQNFFKLEKKN